MRIKQLIYLAKIVEVGSVNEAAKHLFITQPSLSNSIKELEQEMGIHIFQRTQKGMILTNQGVEFLAYARQILEKVDLMEEKYKEIEPKKKQFSISTHRYTFAVHAFIQLIQSYEKTEYEFTFRETQISNVINDVSTFQSQLGILYLHSFNEKHILKCLQEKQLLYQPLFTAKPHIFVSKKNPLALKKMITLNDLAPFPYLSFELEQNYPSYFSESLIDKYTHKKKIQINDRATLIDCLVNLNGYTISSGLFSHSWDCEHFVSLPFEISETIQIGWIQPIRLTLSLIGKEYLRCLKKYILANDSFNEINE